MGVQVEHSFINTEDGVPLFVRSLRPDGEPKGVVMLLHAMMTDGRTLCHPGRDSLGSVMRERGWEVHCPDFRGHGASRRGHPSRRPWTYHDLVSLDVPRLIRFATERSPSLPLCVVGHSLGGHVAAASVVAGFSPEPAAWAFLGVNVWEPYPGHPRSRALLKSAILLAFDRLSRRLGYFPARRLGIGSVDEAAPYVADLVRFWRSGSWGPRDRPDYRDGTDGLAAPALGVYGVGDRWMAPVRDGEAWLQRLSAGEAEIWHARAGVDGLKTDPDHMGLACDPASRPLWERLETWLATRCVSDRPAS
jgi:predicted alpha/beta hydrolase